MLAFGAVEYLKRTLPNGVRILVSEMPETRSASLAVFVGAGSRMESRKDAGTSHFLEHMVFKGTAKRPTAADISMEIESRGAVVNALAGKVDANEVSDAIAELCAPIADRKPPRLKPAPKPSKTRVKLLGKRTEQAHVCIGWRGVPQVHPDKYTLDMLNAILGEGMSSRLFLELREKRALAYDVHSFSSNYLDAGHEVIYAGIAPDRIGEVVDAALAQVARLRDEIVPPDELERVRDFNKGRLELRLEDTRGVSNWLAGPELVLDRVRTVEEVCDIIDSVSAEDIQRAAQQYLRPELAYVAAVGPRAAAATVRAPAGADRAMEIAS